MKLLINIAIELFFEHNFNSNTSLTLSLFACILYTSSSPNFAPHDTASVKELCSVKSCTCRTMNCFVFALLSSNVFVSQIPKCQQNVYLIRMQDTLTVSG